MNHDKLSVPHGLSLRKDLVIREIDMRGHSTWVVKDPVSLEFYYFSKNEYEILISLNQVETLKELRVKCSKGLEPGYLHPNTLLAFLSEAVGKGIVNSSKVRKSFSIKDDKRKSKNKFNLLAFRLPGINPGKVIDELYRFTKPLFNGYFITGTLVLFAIAILLIVSKFDEMIFQYSGIQSWFTPSMILVIGLTIAFCKTCHELSHALFCKHYGGQCREIGIIFLVFIPCLYCNVTDAWLFPKRRERILVSFAGIYMEFILASIATILWAFSTSGSLRMACLSIMAVCSISTVLVNGNPLLKYDGYYILSDLLGIPNLSSKASGKISQLLRGFLWGIPKTVGESSGTDKSSVIIIYGFLSFLYRTFVLCLIFWGIMQTFAYWRLRPIAWLVALVILGEMLVRQFIYYMKPPKGYKQRKMMRFQNRTTSWAILLFTACVILFVPIPRSITVPVIVEPDNAQKIYSTSSGRLMSSREYGSSVNRNEILCTLRNNRLKNELLELKSEEEILKLKLKQIIENRNSSLDASQIPIYEAAVKSLTKQLEIQQREYDLLTVKAPSEGFIIQPQNRLDEIEGDRHIQLWAGTPFESENNGCYIEKGTLLCLIGNSDELVATAFIDQKEIELLKEKQKTKLLFPGYYVDDLNGEVLSIDPAPAKEIPREIAIKNTIPMEVASGDKYIPKEPCYRVKISLESSGSKVSIRTSGMVKIQIESSSLCSRLWRFFLDSFNFNL